MVLYYQLYKLRSEKSIHLHVFDVPFLMLDDTLLQILQLKSDFLETEQTAVG